MEKSAMVHSVDVLKSTKTPRFDCDRGYSFYLASTDDMILQAPLHPKDGVFRLLFVQGSAPHNLGFHTSFEFPRNTAPFVDQKPHSLTEITITIIDEGDKHRFFATDILGNIEQAKRYALNMAMIWGN